MIDYRYLSIANDTHAATAKARAIVMEIERNLGFEPTDREYEKLGYDIGNDTYCDYYVRQPFHREPDFGVISVNYNFDELIARAEEPKLYRCL